MLTPSRDIELDILGSLRASFGEGALLAGVDEVGVLGWEDGDADVGGTLLTLRPVDDAEMLA